MKLVFVQLIIPGAVLSDDSVHAINVTGGFDSVNYVDVRDSRLQTNGSIDFSGLNPPNSIDSGNNQGWFFIATYGTGGTGSSTWTGCTYLNAINYDSAAITDDGSCVFESTPAAPESPVSESPTIDPPTPPVPLASCESTGYRLCESGFYFSEFVEFQESVACE